MKIKQVFIDLDGVLANFTKAAFALFGQEEPKVYTTTWVHDILSVTEAEFWSRIDYDFWLGLEPMPDMQEILDVVMGMVGPFKCCILTSPSLHAPAASQKMAWIQKHVPVLSRRFLIGACKEAVAGPGKILIDDLDFNIKGFNDAGGLGIIVPRPWNKAAELLKITTAAEYIADRLADAMMAEVRDG